MSLLGGYSLLAQNYEYGVISPGPGPLFRFRGRVNWGSLRSSNHSLVNVWLELRRLPQILLVLVRRTIN